MTFASCQNLMEIDMQETPDEPMSGENVDEFEVWIFESRTLDVLVISLGYPCTFASENYEI